MENKQVSDTSSEPSIDTKNIFVSEDTINITLEDCLVTYFTEYLALKCIEKFNSEHCKDQLVVEKETTKFKYSL